MKKITVAVILTALSSTGLFASNESKINRKVLDAFQQEYYNASDVKWKFQDTYVIASFILDDTRMEALYEYGGDKIGSQTHFNIEKLPTRIKRKLASKYNGYAIKESIQFEAATETAYFLCAENDQRRVYLKLVDGCMKEVKVVNK